MHRPAPPRLRVLVLARADDVELGRHLAPRGFEVASASTHAEAMHAIDASPPQLVLAEVDEDGDGLALLEATCDRLQRDGRRPPVLASARSEAIALRLRSIVPRLSEILRPPYSAIALVDAVCRAVLHHAFAHGPVDALVLRAIGFTRARKVRPRRGITVRRIAPIDDED